MLVPLQDIYKIRGAIHDGPRVLISPVTEENATSWPAYLPVFPDEGDEQALWVYLWNRTTTKAVNGWRSIPRAFRIFHCSIGGQGLK